MDEVSYRKLVDLLYEDMTDRVRELEQANETLQAAADARGDEVANLREQAARPARRTYARRKPVRRKAKTTAKRKTSRRKTSRP